MNRQLVDLLWSRYDAPVWTGVVAWVVFGALMMLAFYCDAR